MDTSNQELTREFRILRQSLSMHSTLRDRYARRALAVDLILLGCSVIFCATSFSRRDILAPVVMSTQNVGALLGIVSIIAFFMAIVSLRVDWKGRSARHNDAVNKLNAVLAIFRKNIENDGKWNNECGDKLNNAYWEAMNNIIPIPERQFTSLKAKHLRKVTLSKMLDKAPGSPVCFLRLLIRCRSIRDSVALKTTGNMGFGNGDERRGEQKAKKDNKCIPNGKG